MCGRFYAGDETITRFRDSGWLNAVLTPRAEEALRPNYNAAPKQWHPIILRPGAESIIDMARWGIDKKFGREKTVFMINAKSENLASTFGAAFKRPDAQQGRCIVPASGFIEWQASTTPKQPYAIERSDGEPLLMAGVWVRQERPIDWDKLNLEPLPDPIGDLPSIVEGPELPAEVIHFAIITCEPSADVSGLHNRQPVILEAGSADTWLDQTTPAQQAQGLMLCLAPGALRTRPISTRVNSVKNNDPECLLAV